MDKEWKRLDAAYSHHKALAVSIPDLTEAIYNQGMADAFLQERDRYSIPREDENNAPSSSPVEMKPVEMKPVSIPLEWAETIKVILEVLKKKQETEGKQVPGVLWNAIEVMKESIEKARVETLSLDITMKIAEGDC
jgi:hypothetical protein